MKATKQEIDAELAKIRDSNAGDPPYSDYQLLRQAEANYGGFFIMCIFLTMQLMHTIYKSEGRASFWYFVPFPLGLLGCLWIYAKLKKYHNYCSYFEARIGPEPIKDEEIK
jgi:hypothetical protein